MSSYRRVTISAVCCGVVVQEMLGLFMTENEFGKAWLYVGGS